jgi:DNA-binding CsgD family transcriptional regulator
MTRRSDPSTLEKLCQRELRVAELAALGYSNREIASELEMTEQIVKNVLHSVFDRVGVWNRVELANHFSRDFDRARAEFTRLRQPVQCKSIGVPLTQQTMSPDSGMELRDLLADSEFPLRKKRMRQESRTAEAYRTVARVFADNPDIILQHLVDAATAFCGADSAGISLEEDNQNKEERKFRWIAISGTFASFLGGTTPRFFSPCGTTLDSGRAQLYRVGKTYYDYLGIKADPITDGILIPWQAGEVRGTIWAVSHRSREAFDIEDFKLIEGLADFASIAVENSFRQGTVRDSDKNYAVKDMDSRLP